MTKTILLSACMLISASFLFAQNKDKKEPKEKKTVKEVMSEIPDMLIAQPDAGPDSNANKLINDNLSLVINPLWKEKGLQTIIDFKVLKTDLDPLKTTFPLSNKKLSQGLVINIGTMKKTAAEKKQAVLNVVKSHISAYYKEAQMSISPQELSNKANAMIVSSEPFTTGEGKPGDIYYINDIQTTQSNFIILLLVPGAVSNTVHFVQFTYMHYTYETTYPEDLMEWKMFVYPEDQQTYIDFTKSILKTFKIR